MKKLILLILSLSLGGLLYAQMKTSETTDYKLVFYDDFDQDTGKPDPKYWSFAVPDGAPWSIYLSKSYDQAYLQDGKLVLKAEKAKRYRTGGIWTKGKVAFKYGKLEVRAKFKSVQGGWPAIWLLPVSPQYSTGYGGEIDLMEQVSHEYMAWHSVHPGSEEYRGSGLGGKYVLDDFNTYTLVWTADELSFFINGVSTGTYLRNTQLPESEACKQWVFDIPYYLILNYALGGEGTWPGVINDEELPGYMEVDWIKAYEKVPTGFSQHTFADPMKVSVEGKEICVENTTGEVSVYDYSGRLVERIDIVDSARITVKDTGCYILKYGNQVVKVSVS
ncbi:glycoside hydrolase family 16 protein [Bacteroides sp. HPS0048]|uniref:glycoside hydrolase family 16 protein n=1 Tax=Bacteroides sp. HPS0048 TaxID=1078089 RepID=UPI003568D47B